MTILKLADVIFEKMDDLDVYLEVLGEKLGNHSDFISSVGLVGLGDLAQVDYSADELDELHSALDTFENALREFMGAVYRFDKNQKEEDDE